MVIKHHLNIVICFQFCPSGVVSRINIGVDIDQLAISFIFEKQSLGTVGDDLVVRRRVGGGQLSLPVIVAQVSGFGQ